MRLCNALLCHLVSGAQQCCCSERVSELYPWRRRRRRRRLGRARGGCERRGALSSVRYKAQCYSHCATSIRRQRCAARAPPDSGASVRPCVCERRRRMRQSAATSATNAPPPPPPHCSARARSLVPTSGGLCAPTARNEHKCAPRPPERNLGPACPRRASCARFRAARAMRSARADCAPCCSPASRWQASERVGGGAGGGVIAQADAHSSN